MWLALSLAQSGSKKMKKKDLVTCERVPDGTYRHEGSLIVSHGSTLAIAADKPGQKLHVGSLPAGWFLARGADSSAPLAFLTPEMLAALRLVLFHYDALVARSGDEPPDVEAAYNLANSFLLGIAEGTGSNEGQSQ